MKKKPLLLLSLTFIGFCNFQQLQSQSLIHGVIKNGHGKTLESANVLLLKSLDSSLVKGMMTDASGKYSFANIKVGNYLVTATFSGMNQKYTTQFEITADKKDLYLDVLTLVNTDVELKDVTVITKKPLFEQKIDRMVINVQNSITNAGGTALDVLEKSPGVTVNRQNNSVAVNGKNGVVVMLNGKISYMPLEALVQMLDGISAANIDRIELITTPPARYDAEGNAGYINIVLINNPNAGFNGSYFLTAGYGKKPLGAAGTNFNYRTGKINFFGNYSLNADHTLSYGTGFTQVEKETHILTNTSFSNRDAVRRVHNARIGIDYQVDTATVIGALISGYDSRWTMLANNGATVQINESVDTTIITVDDELNHWQNLMTNLNYQHTFKAGKVINFDANYIYYKDNNPNFYSNMYHDGTHKFLYKEEIRSGKITPINFWVFSGDYATTIGKKVSLEAGAKLTLSKFTNDVSVDRLKLNIWVGDRALSANYLLKEDIAAVYASFTITLNPKTSMKAGLRYEHTTSNLGTTETADIVDRKYGELFPTLYLSRKLNDDNSINFSYSRRITRPTFNDLAPFTIFFDPKTFFSGNPALQPAIANSVQASYSLKNYIFSLSYTYEKNTIEGFQTQRIDTVSNLLYLSARNFNYEQFATASISLPFTIVKWWSMQNNINVNWKQVNTTYNQAPVQLQVIDYNFNSTQRFTLRKEVSLELTGYYYSASYFGTAKLEPVYQVDLGIQKKFKNQKDILRVSANDIFNSGTNYRFVENLPIPGAVIRGSLNFGMVAYKITFTHSFGNNSLKARRDRSTGAENELNRVRN